MVKRDGVILEQAAVRAVTSFPCREGFLSPTRGTEGVVKTIEKAWLEVKLSLQERQRGRKTFEKGHWDSRIYFMNFA